MPDIQRLVKFVLGTDGKLAILTGAGVSTASGIPDYRGPNGVYVRNKDYKPIQYQEFMGKHTFRQRYWARSFLGWPQILRARPNPTHSSINDIRQQGLVKAGLITQNVDGLHGPGTLELHGTVTCTNTSCKHEIPRSKFQQILAELNPKVTKWAAKNPDKIDGDVSSSVNPDGDVEVTWDYSEFRYPSCQICETGIYKPSVVFFGENIEQKVRDESFRIIDAAKGLLIVGSSLHVYSAFRLLKHAADRKIPVAVLNLAPVRGMELVDEFVEGPCHEILPRVADALRTSRVA
ncbi:NAD-dependent protein lipoamidase sirtuin-4 [Blyttiomyces sp. JEL0837]|nr:NAD-dependent protein lipoamidase sirtuin-4 [Blyttiomyces sp. JEL0837]